MSKEAETLSEAIKKLEGASYEKIDELKNKVERIGIQPYMIEKPRSKVHET